MQRVLIVLFTLLCLYSPSLLAQTAATASVSGVVTDEGGGVVPGVSVQLADPATNRKLETVTGDTGTYVFPVVPPGVYDLTATMPGFKQSVIKGIDIRVARAITQDIVLAVGGVETTVEVAAETTIELQKQDASIGNVLRGDLMRKLPNITRQAESLLALQPLVQPSGEVAGARRDQSTFSLDGTDTSDNVIGQAFRSVIPVPIEFVEEARVTVANPNATFGRSSGGQVALISRRGTNAYHGSVYFYHQNDNLDANTWTNNRLGIKKPEKKDHRFGFTVGGPVFKDKAFFFAGYEGRRFPRSIDIVRAVPSDTLKQGTLRFRAANGQVVSYPVVQFDPRKLGLNPLISKIFSLFPEGNDPTFGDGLNAVGFRGPVSAPIESEYGQVRADYEINERWQTMLKFAAFRQVTTRADIQVDITGGKLVSPFINPSRPRHAVVALNGTLTSNLNNDFRFSWLHDRLAFSAVSPRPQIQEVNMALDLAGRFLLDEPIDVDTQRARSQARTLNVYQLIDNISWSRGNHSFQFGGNWRHIRSFDFRDDKVVGSLAHLVANLDANAFLTVPASQRPPTCSATVTANCLTSGDVSRWNRHYVTMLGMVSQTTIMIARDGSLKPLPFGTGLTANSKLNAFEMYFNDTWRLNPSLTLNYGLMYQFQTPPVERDGKQTFMINNTNGDILTARSYLSAKRAAAEKGEVFNPQLAYLPIGDSSRTKIFDTDWSNWGPRAGVAWSPSGADGFAGWLFGNRRFVLRGGYSLIYDRFNTVSTIIIPQLGVGFAQTISVNSPKNSNGDPFRVGVDGPIPVPLATPAKSPIVPTRPLEELLSFQVDPEIKVPRNHLIDVTIQRELPGDYVLEVGYVGRLGRNLFQSVNLNNVPYMHKDPVSGQTFAQAFDAVATVLRSGGSVSPQPWFENQLFTGATAVLARSFVSQFVDGQLSELFLNMDFIRLGAKKTPFNFLPATELFMRTYRGRSNYHAALFTLRKRYTNGLAFDLNYTLSKSLDQVGEWQNSAGFFPNSFDFDSDYGPSFFDRRHTLNIHGVYELPFGRGRRFLSGNDVLDKVVGGWYVSPIVEAFSGLPLSVTQSSQVWGAGLIFGFGSGAIPTKKLDLENVPHRTVGSGGVGTTAAGRGSGLNLFTNPEDVFKSFRRIEISKDGRAGRGVLRGFPFWTVSLEIGKETRITEEVKVTFAADFFSIFNNVVFNNPSLTLTNPAAFGVVTSQGNAPRGIQFGLRVDF